VALEHLLVQCEREAGFGPNRSGPLIQVRMTLTEAPPFKQRSAAHPKFQIRGWPTRQLALQYWETGEFSEWGGLAVAFNSYSMVEIIGWAMPVIESTIFRVEIRCQAWNKEGSGSFVE
jgi:hypothetical protein